MVELRRDEVVATLGRHERLTHQLEERGSFGVVHAGESTKAAARRSLCPDRDRPAKERDRDDVGLARSCSLGLRALDDKDPLPVPHDAAQIQKVSRP